METNEADLNRMNVKQLRALLKDKGLKIPRLKADMIRALLESGIQAPIEPTEISVLRSPVFQPSLEIPVYFSQEELIQKLSNLPLNIPKTEENERKINTFVQNFIKELTSLSPIINYEIESESELLNLPNEKIYEICEKLDNDSLSKLVRTNKRLYDVCNVIIEKRLKDKQESKLIIFRKYPGIGVSISKSGDHYDVNQSFVTSRNDLPNAEKWIDSKTPYTEEIIPEGNGIRVKRKATIRPDYLPGLIRLLRDYGYYGGK